jgi:hypothetical protein
MPNWVYNTITVEGSRRDLEDFVAIVGAPVVVRRQSFDGATAGEWVEEVLSVPFTYYNVIPVPTDILDDYHTVADGKEGPNNWYNWNCREWGVKWDASDPSLEWDEDGRDSLTVRFESPWGPPEPVFAALARTFPSLFFSFHYEEEQGWGSRLESTVGGALVEVESWDIPESHAENAHLGRACVCDWADDEDWFDDCPRPDSEYHDALIASALEDADELSA